MAAQRRVLDDAMGRARFEREGQAQASLPPHPNVVRVFGAGELQGVPYLLTELAPGGDLRVRLRQGPVPALEACGMFAGLARALGATAVAQRSASAAVRFTGPPPS